MNLYLLNEYVQILYLWVWLPILSVSFFFSWFPNTTRNIFKSYTDLFHGAFNILTNLGFVLYTALISIFISSAGIIYFNYDFWTNILITIGFLYIVHETITILGRKITLIIIVGPFIFFYFIFFYFLMGEQIYKISKYCENTSVSNIKQCIHSNGVYTGELKAFKRHGTGKYTWNSGIIYEGEWQNNLRHGKGVTTDLNGIKSVENWDKGKKIN